MPPVEARLAKVIGLGAPPLTMFVPETSRAVPPVASTLPTVCEWTDLPVPTSIEFPPMTRLAASPIRRCPALAIDRWS